ncbi:MAG TPA: hypothetical protein VGQ59_09800 [Cyclobacteriaceae bacterium]|nr:hypothetical protein [Cyclobacteriaceae bacterium]
MMNFIVKHWEKIGSVLLITIGLLAFGKFFYNQAHFQFYPAYTTGVVTKLSKNARGNPFVKYEFDVHGKMLQGESSYGSALHPKVGEKYPVVYSYKDPSVCRMEIHADNQVP